jgi:hypothetical protein
LFDLCQELGDDPSHPEKEESMAAASITEAANAVREGALQAEVTTSEGTVVRFAKPLETDVWIYRIVVLVLGAAILGVVASALLLKLIDNQTGIPDALVAIGTGALGALAGLLAPTPGAVGGGRTTGN